VVSGIRMTPEQIIAIVATGESDTLEFKETTRRRREAAQTMCAMLNHRGGRVLFGVTPEGYAAGQQVSAHGTWAGSTVEPPVIKIMAYSQADTMQLLENKGVGLLWLIMAYSQATGH